MKKLVIVLTMVLILTGPMIACCDPDPAKNPCQASPNEGSTKTIYERGSED
jgi:hypothetical protein